MASLRLYAGTIERIRLAPFSSPWGPVRDRRARSAGSALIYAMNYKHGRHTRCFIIAPKPSSIQRLLADWLGTPFGKNRSSESDTSRFEPSQRVVRYGASVWRTRKMVTVLIYQMNTCRSPNFKVRPFAAYLVRSSIGNELFCNYFILILKIMTKVSWNIFQNINKLYKYCSYTLIHIYDH